MDNSRCLVLVPLPLLSLCSTGTRSLESLCLQVTDLFPGLRRMQSVLPEHGCLLVSPGNYWQNQRELFDSDPDLLKTIQKHEPKGLHTSATLRGNAKASRLTVSSHFLLFLRAWKCVNTDDDDDEESYERAPSSLRRFRIG